jgi:ABC-type polysaccharide/polyol phosphate transport system ATPase subunit
MSNWAIQAEGLGKHYRLGALHGRQGLRGAMERVLRGQLGGGEEMWALRDVSFSVRSGETLALVGGNGAGKSVLLKILARVTKPSAGIARLRGRIGAMLASGRGLSWHAERRATSIHLSGAILGVPTATIARQFDEIVDFAGVAAVRRYGECGTIQAVCRRAWRLPIAAQLETEIMLLDEVLSVADRDFRERCIDRIRQAATKGRTVILVSHDDEVVERLCTRALWLDHGRIVMDGTGANVLRAYRGAAAAS